MNHRLFSTFLILLSGLASSADAGDAILQIRAVLHDPSKPDARFFVGKVGGTLSPLKLVEEGLADPQQVSTENDSLNLFSTATVDKNDPKASLAATVKIPAGANRLMVFILPSNKGTTPYSMVVLNDDAQSFPWGESKAMNLTSVDFAVEIGEHRILVPGGKVIPVPKVTKLDEYNRAQTNFHYKQADAWVVAAERQMQYANSLRRVFLIYKTPDAVAPDVRTIVDQPPPEFDQQK